MVRTLSQKADFTDIGGHHRRLSARVGVTQHHGRNRCAGIDGRLEERAVERQHMVATTGGAFGKDADPTAAAQFADQVLAGALRRQS